MPNGMPNAKKIFVTRCVMDVSAPTGIWICSSSTFLRQP